MKVCDRFDTGRGPLYICIPSDRWTDVMSSMPSFSRSKGEGVSSLSLMPQIQRIIDKFCILIKISLRFVSKDPNDVIIGSGYG